MRMYRRRVHTVLAPVASLVTLFLVSLSAQRAGAHCQVPCGIYDDSARIHALSEHATTIEKAVNALSRLAKKTDAQSRNQFVRWVNVKDAHAEKIMRVVADYFLAQKIKPVSRSDKSYKKYVQSLAMHHAVMIAAMKCKQTVSLTNVAELRRSIKAIAPYWVR